MVLPWFSSPSLSPCGLRGNRRLAMRGVDPHDAVEEPVIVVVRALRPARNGEAPPGDDLLQRRFRAQLVPLLVERADDQAAVGRYHLAQEPLNQIALAAQR